MEVDGEGRECRVAIASVSIVLALLAAPATMRPAEGLEDGRIGVLYVGCIARSQPFWSMRRDPMFSINFVQATMRDWGARASTYQAEEGGVVRRLVRLYMPRTYASLVEGYDVVVVSNANQFAVGAKNTEMLARAVREGGLGLFMSGGWESFGGTAGHPPWGCTSIGELLPTIDVVDIWVDNPRNLLFWDPVDVENELIASLPWDLKSGCMTDFHHNVVQVKPGGELLARVTSTAFDSHPAMVTWRLENGVRVLALTGEIHRFSTEGVWWGYDFGVGWGYGYDFGCNTMIYVDGRPVPQDIELVHSVRSKLLNMATRKNLLLGLLDFCDLFGANTDGMMGKVDEVDAIIAASTPKYLELRFSEVLEDYEEIEEMFVRLEVDAVKLKNRTLLWVYLVEWLAITATVLLSGVFIWAVMVRRRLYREVGSTKLADASSSPRRRET